MTQVVKSIGSKKRFRVEDGKLILQVKVQKFYRMAPPTEEWRDAKVEDFLFEANINLFQE